MFPACALFEELRKKSHDVCMITDKRGEVFCKDIQRKIVFATVRFSYKSILSILANFTVVFFRLLKMWRGQRPKVIVSFGGISTFVPVLVAKLLGAKVVVYEQNAVMGKANLLLSKIANLKLSSFDFGDGWTQIQAPVREGFRRTIPYKCDDKLKILIIGGSQGARSFSEIIPNFLARLTEYEKKKIEIVQQVSYGDIEALSATYDKLHVKHKLLKFIDNVAEIMQDSQLAICRAGASTLAELSALGCPAILIPLPTSAENHQFFNAMSYQKKGAAWVLEEKSGVDKLIADKVKVFLQNRELLKKAASCMMNDSMENDRNRFLRLVESVSGEISK